VKVRVVPFQPHCFHFGGFDIQMYRVNELLRSQGIDAEPLNYWSKDGDFDVLHFWGLEPSHLITMRYAKAYGKKITLSAILPYITFNTQIRRIGSYLLGRRRHVQEILSYVDKLFVHNDLQVEAAIKMYDVEPEKIEIVPSILDPFFFSSQDLQPFDGLRGYILCVGNISPRKNQLLLAQAAIIANSPIVFIGNILGGEESYTRRFQELINANPLFRWYKWISFDEIRSVYVNSIGIALPSYDECQPGSAFEGAAIGKPLLLANRPYAHQKYFSGAKLVEPNSISSIANGLSEIMNNPRYFVPSREIMAECHPDQIAKRLKDIFSKL